MTEPNSEIGEGFGLPIMIGGALAAAGMLVFAAPPFDLWPLALLSMALLFSVTRKANPWQMGAVFLLCFLGSLSVACIWWHSTLIRFADLPPMTAWLYLAVICIWQTLPYGIWGAATGFLHRRFGVSLFLAAPLLFVVIESLAVFPLKNFMAITVWQVAPLTQIAELGGPPAVFALVVLCGLLLAEVPRFIREKNKPGAAFTRAGLVCVALVLLGSLRLWHVSSAQSQAPSIRVGLVQPNFGNATISERERHGAAMIKNLRKASLDAATGGVNLVVWPESAWPYLLDRTLERGFPPGHPWELMPGVDAALLFGSLSHTFGGHEVYNSAVLVGEDGVIAGRHDKNLLVPFAETIPFEKRFPQWAAGMRERLKDKPDLVHGEPPEVLVSSNLRLGPMICSEDLDMAFVRHLAGQNPNLLVGIASDAWFGDSAAPSQHMALATFRCIETRRGMVRAANTGVSGFIMPTGRLVAKTEVVEGKGDGSMRPVTLQKTMPLSELSSAGGLIPIFPWLCLLGLAVCIFLNRRKA